MALHNMIADCSKITQIGMHAPIAKVELTPEEEKAELARWAMEDAKQKAYVRPSTLEAQVIELQAQIKVLQDKMGIT